MPNTNERKQNADSTSDQPHVQSVPDTATTYERAKPGKESPAGKLDQAPADEGKSPDPLQQDNAPAAPAKSAARKE